MIRDWVKLNRRTQWTQFVWVKSTNIARMLKILTDLAPQAALEKQEDWANVMLRHPN